MRSENILVFGISGVGKTTSCRRFIQRHPICQYFSASELLQSAKNTDSEDLRMSSIFSITENQKLLGRIFNEARSRDFHKPALVDVHAIIYNDFSYVQVPVEAVRGLKPTALILLEAPPALVASRRRLEQRWRPIKTEQELAEEARLEKLAVHYYADTLSLPLEIGSTESEDVLERLVPRLLKTSL